MEAATTTTRNVEGGGESEAISLPPLLRASPAEQKHLTRGATAAPTKGESNQLSCIPHSSYSPTPDRRSSPSEICPCERWKFGAEPSYSTGGFVESRRKTQGSEVRPFSERKQYPSKKRRRWEGKGRQIDLTLRALLPNNHPFRRVYICAT